MERRTWCCPWHGVARNWATTPGRESWRMKRAHGTKPVPSRSWLGALSGRSPSAEAITEACENVAESLEYPLGDIYASGEYRTHLATVLSRRALTEAFKRAKKQK